MAEPSRSPIIGKRVAVVWKKQSGSVAGGTEGLALGMIGDKDSGEFLVIDRSTYDISLKSALFSLGILDLRVLPVNEIESIRQFDLRKRPPGVIEEFSWYIRIDLKSNIDYNATEIKLKTRNDFLVKPNLPVQTEQPCQLVIQNINGIEGATVNISPTGTVQIFCSPLRLNDCISWLQNAVEILPGHKRLVFIPTDFQLTIQDGYRLSAKPAEEIIDRLAKSEGNQPVLFPLGWIHKFFVELDKNPLEELFSDSEFDREKVLVPRSKRKKNTKGKRKLYAFNSKEPVSHDFSFPQNILKVEEILGAEVPTMRITGLIKSIEDETGLMKMWQESRSDIWQWLDSPEIHGKVVIHDLTINRKTGIYTADIQKYSGDSFHQQSNL